MIVYSVMIERSSTGEHWFEGPWPESWAAEAHAESHNTDCRRVVIQWQMLNAEWGRTFAPETPSGSVAE